MEPNNFTRSSMDAGYVITESNALSSYSNSDEKKALKRAKEAEIAFRKSKGLETDTIWQKCFKALLKKSK